MVKGGYITYNHAMLTTTAFAPVALGTTLKTQLQLATVASRRITILGWGYTLDASPTAVSKFELLQTDVAANTGTALTLATAVQKLDPADPDCTALQSGAALTGHSFGAEGAIAATRFLGHDLLPANAVSDRLRWAEWFLPGKEPILAASSFLRIRTTLGSAANGLVWIAHKE